MGQLGQIVEDSRRIRGPRAVVQLGYRAERLPQPLPVVMFPHADTLTGMDDMLQPAALATVVATRSSAPRPVGSKLILREDGSIEGSVSNGCVENDVVLAAQEVLD